MIKILLASILLATFSFYLIGNNDQINTLSSQYTSSSKLYQDFQEWQQIHNKKYINGQDIMYRFGVWIMNKMYVESKKSSTAGLNSMADLTNEEFKQRYLNQTIKKQRLQSQKGAGACYYDKEAAQPTSWNWVEKGAVTPVQNQGNCGAYYAFGAVGALEGLWFVTSGDLVKMSEQQIVSCDENNFGCNGGLELLAYDYTSENGIMTQASYPYISGVTQTRGSCKYNEDNVVFKNVNSCQVPTNNIKDLVGTLVEQPLSKGISGNSQAFQLYSGGVFDDSSCGDSLDHSVLMVGFNDNTSTPYWTIKNSWGTGWGEKGYMQIAKGDDGQNGVCGINIDSTAPTL